MKVVVLGAAGGIGQSLSLLLKLQLPKDTELALYDVASVTPGVAVDLSHIPTSVSVKGYNEQNLEQALRGAALVLITAGIARKPGMDRSDLFTINAGIIEKLIHQIAITCPKACIAIVTNPVNAMVAVAAETLKKMGVYDRRRLFGVTTLDILRANTFVAELKGCKPEETTIPVIGGHSGVTILPLLSYAYGLTFNQEEIKGLTKRIQDAGTEVVEAKAGEGSATLSMAYAAARFGLSVLRGLLGESNIVEYAYIEGDGQYARFFAQPIVLGTHGIENTLPIGDLSEEEQEYLITMLPQLENDISMGENFSH